MSEKFFANFPMIIYSNTVCVDISRRAVVSNTVQTNMFAYYPYEMKSHQRPDTIAGGYYDNPYFSWLVYLSNDTVDPYYDYPLGDSTFLKYIDRKYGSLANSQQLIMYWQLNWSDSIDEEISPSFYQDNLPEPLKKYYDPVYGENTRVIFYRRRREDWTASTNRIVTFMVSNTNGTFQTGEVVKLKTDSNTSLSNSYVMFANSTQVKVQHVMGNTTLSEDGTEFLQGTLSNTTANVSATIYTANNISEDEQSYWNPVYAWDYEMDLNEKRKFIYLIDSKYAYEIANNLEKKLKA